MKWLRGGARACCLLGMLALAPLAGGAERLSLDGPGFERLHGMLTPQQGESRWMEIDWYPSVWEGLQKAAKEGKPLFLWAGSGGAPAAGC